MEELEGFLVEEEVVEEERQTNQFPSIISSLAWQQMEKQENDFNVTCRWIASHKMSDLSFVQDKHRGYDVWPGLGR